MASGDTLLVFKPLQNEPPATDFATLDVLNDQVVLDFDDTTDESARFSSVLSRHYTGGGITANIGFSTTTAGEPDSTKWEISFERQEGGGLFDLTVDSFASSKTVTKALPSGADRMVYAEIAFTNSEIDCLLKGEHFRVNIKRLDFAGNVSGDAQLRFIELRET